MTVGYGIDVATPPLATRCASTGQNKRLQFGHETSDTDGQDPFFRTLLIKLVNFHWRFAEESDHGRTKL